VQVRVYTPKRLFRQQQQTAAVVEWAPHRQTFRYLLARDVAFPHLS
jgi:hypothetical protein